MFAAVAVPRSEQGGIHIDPDYQTINTHVHCTNCNQQNTRIQYQQYSTYIQPIYFCLMNSTSCCSCCCAAAVCALNVAAEDGASKRLLLLLVWHVRNSLSILLLQVVLLLYCSAAFCR
jgi:hypothetical protein